MNRDKETCELEKLPTGIKGLDLTSYGGLPKGRTTLVSGTVGSGKTILAVQFLAGGIKDAGERGVFVTCEETPTDIRTNMLSLGWDIQQWEDEGKWAFVDASRYPGTEAIENGPYDLGAFLARIEHAVAKLGATRVSVDSLGAIFSQFSDAGTVRRELFRIAVALKRLGVTAVMTTERTEEYGDIARHGVEEFVADNVVLMRNVLDQEKRRRTIEVLKLRGTGHQSGEWPFTVLPAKGIVIVPLSAIEATRKSSTVRVTSGNAELDAMCSGGFFRDFIILVSGATGTGKTLIVTHFVGTAAATGERCLLYAFEENHEQLLRNANGWGVDLEKLEKAGNLRIVCAYPESAGLERHFLSIRDAVEEFKPTRIAVDSLSALEHVATDKSFREFIVGLTLFIKHHGITGMFTSTTPMLMGGMSATEAHVSTIADSIILLRYAEMFGEVRRGLAVLKMRGSTHDKNIREIQVDGMGMHIGRPFQGITGILSGRPRHISRDQIDRASSPSTQEELARTP